MITKEQLKKAVRRYKNLTEEKLENELLVLIEKDKQPLDDEKLADAIIKHAKILGMI